MSSKSDRQLVPEFRFPDFVKLPAWDEQTLLHLCERPLSNGVFNDPAKVGSGYKLINVADMYIEGYIQEGSLSQVEIPRAEFERNKVEFGDIFFTRSSLVKSGIAASNIYLGQSEDVTFDGHLIRLRLNKLKYDPRFINYLLRTQSVRRQLVAKGKTATMTTIGQSDVAATRLSVTKLDEQQKIADCLSSLDDLMAAQAQKIESLKTHKKGLTQQLFPAEGETVPRLRFPEFRNRSQWSSETIGRRTLKVGSGATPRGGEANYKVDGRPFVRSQNVGWGRLILDDIVFIDEGTHLACISTEIASGDVLLNITGASIGRSAVADRRVHGGNVNQHVCIIRTKPNELAPSFLNQYLLSSFGQIQIDSFQAGGNRQGLNFPQIRSILISLPTKLEEQMKVADHLSSIDEIITVQIKEIEALKAHKNGLMQSLFPTADGSAI
jgi:type I restriction enzyme, S subunit